MLRNVPPGSGRRKSKAAAGKGSTAAGSSGRAAKVPRVDHVVNHSHASSMPDDSAAAAAAAAAADAAAAAAAGIPGLLGLDVVGAATLLQEPGGMLAAMYAALWGGGLPAPVVAQPPDLVGVAAAGFPPQTQLAMLMGANGTGAAGSGPSCGAMAAGGDSGDDAAATLCALMSSAGAVGPGGAGGSSGGDAAAALCALLGSAGAAGSGDCAGGVAAALCALLGGAGAAGSSGCAAGVAGTAPAHASGGGWPLMAGPGGGPGGAAWPHDSASLQLQIDLLRQVQVQTTQLQALAAGGAGQFGDDLHRSSGDGDATMRGRSLYAETSLEALMASGGPEKARGGRSFACLLALGSASASAASLVPSLDGLSLSPHRAGGPVQCASESGIGRASPPAPLQSFDGVRQQPPLAVLLPGAHRVSSAGAAAASGPPLDPGSLAASGALRSSLDHAAAPAAALPPPAIDAARTCSPSKRRRTSVDAAATARGHSLDASSAPINSANACSRFDGDAMDSSVVKAPLGHSLGASPAALEGGPACDVNVSSCDGVGAGGDTCMEPWVEGGSGTDALSAPLAGATVCSWAGGMEGSGDLAAPLASMDVSHAPLGTCGNMCGVVCVSGPPPSLDSWVQGGMDVSLGHSLDASSAPVAGANVYGWLDGDGGDSSADGPRTGPSLDSSSVPLVCGSACGSAGVGDGGDCLSSLSAPLDGGPLSATLCGGACGAIARSSSGGDGSLGHGAPRSAPGLAWPSRVPTAHILSPVGGVAPPRMQARRAASVPLPLHYYHHHRTPFASTSPRVGEEHAAGDVSERAHGGRSVLLVLRSLQALSPSGC
ncbi:hypothetical protein FOA52_012105 [Chlamydomonas sp. UWO 241]|nr:hypothetical protein FOA52_012105 [Chlamydomonas sp. UWO 241]